MTVIYGSFMSQFASNFVGVVCNMYTKNEGYIKNFYRLVKKQRNLKWCMDQICIGPNIYTYSEKVATSNQTNISTYYCFVIFAVLFCQFSLRRAEETETGETARSDDFDDDEQKITKRSGSGSQDFFYHLKNNIAGTLSKTSASLSAGSSPHAAKASSSNHGYKYGGNSIDSWNFKSSFFGTIKQAVKAITGGVTAIKGQLIKGSGIVLSASGKVVAASGDKISDLGKAKVNSAQFHHVDHHGYGESVHPLHKLSSLSSSSSGHSGSGKEIHSKPPPAVHHTETITTYEIPVDHVNSGPPNHPIHYGQHPHHGRPSDAYIGSLPPHISAAQELPYEYHSHTFEGDNYYYSH
ncbi:uncharacterized protein LOC129616390 [Condylostylus longicornis]|uniref:uncharacterized protein LOC129616390 n=1 Tax=Condylostylus longicornis TaxID=2530218 RepID=UPI00244E4F87|nr:uncharacterized protein LOC129616390 [Condylostylus longicornis]